ncbi:MAG: 50S ribosomal protein L29 [Candidatus Acidiferrales bacterium]
MPRRVLKFRDLSNDELQRQERELAEQVFRLRFALATGQAEGLKRLRETRKDLARVKTLLREEELRKSNGQR